MRFLIMILAYLLSSLLVQVAYAGTQPYNVNERLIFDISYFGISGGTTVLEVAGIRRVGGADAFHIVSTTKTNKFFSRIYKVRDVIETFIDMNKYHTLAMKIDQREGKHKKYAEIKFDQNNNKAIISKKYGQKIVYDIVNDVQDSLSSLFYVRRQELIVGKDIVFNTYASRRSWQLVVKVLKRERIKVQAGAFDTVLVKPLLKFNDVFVNKGDVYIWLSDDEYKVPVMMKSEIIIGSITAELISLVTGTLH